jgi:hypothetical protein
MRQKCNSVKEAQTPFAERRFSAIKTQFFCWLSTVLTSTNAHQMAVLL